MALELEQVLKEVISEVLESMFFAMVEFEGCGPGDGPFDYASEINLTNHKGRIAICLRVSEEFARMITANFLGIEESQVHDDDLKDSLKELANMVGGGLHVRSNYADRRLGIPTVRKIESDGMDRAQAASGLGFAFFGEPAGSVVLDHLPD
jgi:hypothetical protein